MNSYDKIYTKSGKIYSKLFNEVFTKIQSMGESQLCVVINVLKSVKSDGAAFLME